MAFTNPSFSMSFTNAQHGNGDIMNPMIPYYADQAMQHAARNPGDQHAQMQAQYWAGLLARKRQALGQAGPVAGAPAFGAPQAPPAPVPSSLPVMPPTPPSTFAEAPAGPGSTSVFH